jgi:hypothetical protein
MRTVLNSGVGRHGAAFTLLPRENGEPGCEATPNLGLSLIERIWNTDLARRGGRDNRRRDPSRSKFRLFECYASRSRIVPIGAA